MGDKSHPDNMIGGDSSFILNANVGAISRRKRAYKVEWLNDKPSKEFSETKHLIYSGSVNFQPTSTALILQAKEDRKTHV